MSERTPDYFDERDLEKALTDDLESVAPGRGLWSAIKATAERAEPRSRRRWLLPAAGSFAALLVVAIVTPVLFLLSSGGPALAPDCLAAEDGALVNAPCDVPAGVTAEPAPTPIPVGNGSGGTDPGFAAFRSAGCAACHAVDGTAARGRVGPNLTTVGSKGAAYIRESIVTPSAAIAAGFTGGIMPQGFGDTLTAEQIDTIVA